MPSQTDLDQGGTIREWDKIYLGPSVGWVWVPYRSQFNITAAGTYTVDLSSNYVRVNVVGAVIIILPPSLNLTIPEGVTPGKAVRNPISIVDSGGNAAANPITIQPNGTETIMGLVQVQITSNFGGFILYPNNGRWTNQS